MKRIFLVLAVVVLTIMPMVAGTALAAKPNAAGGQGATTAATKPAAQHTATTPATENSQGAANSGGPGGGLSQFCAQYDTTAC